MLPEKCARRRIARSVRTYCAESPGRSEGGHFVRMTAQRIPPRAILSLLFGGERAESRWRLSARKSRRSRHCSQQSKSVSARPPCRLTRARTARYVCLRSCTVRKGFRPLPKDQVEMSTPMQRELDAGSVPRLSCLSLRPAPRARARAYWGGIPILLAAEWPRLQKRAPSSRASAR